MADPKSILRNYAGAMKRDLGRDELPPGVLWNVVDFLPSVLNARERKRGGWSNGSEDFGALLGSSSYLEGGVVADFTAGQSVLTWDEDGFLFHALTPTTTAQVGSLGLVGGDAIFYDDKVIITDAAGLLDPRLVTRTGSAHSITALSGGPPEARFGLVYKDVLWLASSALSADRIWFSEAGQPQSYDLVNKYLDVSFPITAMATLSNAVLVWSLNRCARIRGSIPPPDTDFVKDDPVFVEGCTDNRSVAYYQDKVIFANAGGLWITDGTALEDLTHICGQKSWWRDIMNGLDGFNAPGVRYDPSTWGIACGTYGDYLVYSITYGATLVDSGLIDMTKFTWHREDNIAASFFMHREYPDELFWGRRDNSRLATLSSIFIPTADNMDDGNGAAVEPFFETGFGLDTTEMKTMRRAYLNYDLRDGDNSSPEVTLSYIMSPESTDYVDLAAFPVTDEYTRDYRPLNFPSRGIAFKLTLSGHAEDLRVYDIELDAQSREKHR